MFITSVLLVALISARINAVPLNINLGAYSPALVVGDGEISFRGKEEVSELMDALEGAAVSGAAKNGGSNDGTEGEVGQGLGVSQNSPTGKPLQGMGKTISPRIVSIAENGNEKRNLAGFNAALNYASESLTKGPAVELSTGPSGSGVGVRVNPKAAGTRKGKEVVPGNATPLPANQPPVAARPRPQNGLGRRQDTEGNNNSKTETTVTTMLVRGGSNSETESEILEKRSIPSSENTDSVNLNVADGRVAELTFVETRSVDGVEESEE